MYKEKAESALKEKEMIKQKREEQIRKESSADAKLQKICTEIDKANRDIEQIKEQGRAEQEKHKKLKDAITSIRSEMKSLSKEALSLEKKQALKPKRK